MFGIADNIINFKRSCSVYGGNLRTSKQVKLNSYPSSSSLQPNSGKKNKWQPKKKKSQDNCNYEVAGKF